MRGPFPFHLPNGSKAWLTRSAFSVCCSGICLVAVPRAAYADSWTGTDKQLHLAGSAALAVMITKATNDPTLSFWSSVGIGAAKEVADHYRRTGDPSIRDLMADVVGAYLGAHHPGWTVQKSGATTTVVFTWRF